MLLLLLMIKGFEMTEVQQGAVWAASAVMEIWEPDAVKFARAKLGRNISEEVSSRLHVNAEDFASLNIQPDIVGMPSTNRLTTLGITNLTDRLFSTTQQWVPSTGSAGSEVGFTGIGVGNGLSPGDAIGDSDFTGASKSFRICDTGFPTRSVGTLVWKATWQDVEANFDWNEFTLLVPGASATQLSGASAYTNRSSSPIVNYKFLNSKRPAGLGTKNSGGNASLTVTATVSG